MVYELLERNPGQRTVIVLDEVDKMRSNGGFGNLSLGAALEPLLTLMESEARLEPPGHAPLPLRNCMFILLGNQGLEEIQRLPPASDDSFIDAYTLARDRVKSTWFAGAMLSRVDLCHLFLPLTMDDKMRLVRTCRSHHLSPRACCVLILSAAFLCS